MKAKGTTAAPILLIVVFAMLSMLQFADSWVAGISDNPYLAVILLQLFIFALPAVFYCRLRGGKYASRLRLRLPNGGSLMLMVYAFGFMLFGGGAIGLMMYKLLPDVYSATSTLVYTEYAAQSGFFGWIYVFFAFVLLPAVTEEFLFRSVMIAEYEDCGAAIAVFMSSAMFAMSHFNFVRLPVYLFQGIVLGIVFYATRSLFATVTLHAFNNLAALFAESFLQRAALMKSAGVTLIAFGLVSLALLFAALMFGKVSKIYSVYGVLGVQPVVPRTRDKGGMPAALRALLSPSFLLLVTLYIVVSAVL